jgi:hypothetical protein
MDKGLNPMHTEFIGAIVKQRQHCLRSKAFTLVYRFEDEAYFNAFVAGFAMVVIDHPYALPFDLSATAHAR